MSHAPNPGQTVVIVERRGAGITVALLAALALAIAAVMGLFSPASHATPTFTSITPQAVQAAAPAAKPAAAVKAAVVPAAKPATQPVAKPIIKPAAAPAGTPVMIMNYSFGAPLTVPVGTTVTWTNEDSAPHTVTTSSGPAKIDSPTFAKGETFSFTFTKAGTYSYYCAVHPDMKGTITVTGDTTTAAPAPVTASTAPAAAAPTTTAGGDHGDMPMPATPSTASCTNLVDAVYDPFWVHLQHGHLESSPGQQAADILNLDQYTKTHTVLVEAMVAPLMALLPAAMSAANAFWVHVQHGHLESSPGQQAADILAADQYVKTHTVLVENMASATMGVLMGAAC